MKALSGRFVFAAAVAIVFAVMAQATPIDDVTQPYQDVEKTVGRVPLLAILLEPVEPFHNSQCILYGLRPDGSISLYMYNMENLDQTWEQPLPATMTFASAPAVLNTPNGDLQDVFATATDGNIYETFNARADEWRSYRPWTPLPKGPQFQSGPAVMNTPDGKIASVFATGTDGFVYQIIYARGPNGGWRTWTKLPGTQQFSAEPAVLNTVSGEELLVVVLGQDGKYHFNQYHRGPGSHWDSDWTALHKCPSFQSAAAVTMMLTRRYAPEHYGELLFGQKESVRTFYLENSYGSFTFDEAYVTPWLVSGDDPATPDDESRFSYIHGSKQAEKGSHILREVERQTPFRFANYDANKDGFVTEKELAVIWIYPYSGDSGRVRGISPSIVKVPGLNQGVKLWGLARATTKSGYTTMAHELAHEVFHLADLYPGGGSNGCGPFSLMSNPNKGSHLDPWAKIKLGWLFPTYVEKDGWYSLSSSETHPLAYILRDKASSTSEYFIVENRWPDHSCEAGPDGLGDQGIAVWHIDEGYGAPGTDDWGRKTIHILPAGGFSAPTSSWLWDSGDPATAYDLTPTSSPSNTAWYNGKPGTIRITSMPAAADMVGVYFDIP